jgi:hypothetical protein
MRARVMKTWTDDDFERMWSRKGLQLLEQVVSMLVGLIKSCDR